MQTVLSGSRPTGLFHLGNYFGAIANYVKMQDDFDNCYFFIADYHSFTTHTDPLVLPQHVKRAMATYLACGLDPNKASVYVQSDVPEIPELYLLLAMFANKGELEKCTTFKEKARQKGQTLNAGLLTYPVLMAADILVHRAHKVPVGKDQMQHLEMARNFAQRFNHHYDTDFLVLPEAFSYTEELIKILSLDGTGSKMSKSDNNINNAVFLTDTDEAILKKLKKATADAGPQEPNAQKSDAVQGLFNLMQLVSKPETLAEFEAAYNDCSIRYGDFKVQLGKDMVDYVGPIRDKIAELESKPSYLKEVAAAGAETARKSGRETLDGVREIMGINYFA